MRLPFSNTKQLENQIDEFLDVIVQGALAAQQAISSYLGAREDELAARIQQLRDQEHEADRLRKNTEQMLYTYSLIPESRWDVLGLLESLDDVIDLCKEVLQRIDVERPEIPEEFHRLVDDLLQASVHAVDNVVGATRSYFRETQTVRDFINKVDYYESEADEIALRLKKRIFGSEMKLSHKMHLRYFIEQIESISDAAEDVSERLAIATIKRSL